MELLGIAIIGLNLKNCFNIGNIYTISDKFPAGVVGYTAVSNGIAESNVFYLDNVKVYNNFSLGNTIINHPSTKEYMQSREFVNELNSYVDNYEPTSEEITLKRWKYNEGNYPTFETNIEL